MKRYEIIQLLINKIDAKKYLEIGVNSGENFSVIDVEEKIGVDPDIKSKATIYKTSNDFFAENEKTFDVIFIDGLHESDQVEKDIENSLECLNENGYIVCHDLLPRYFQEQEVPKKQPFWMGDCWKAWMKLRMSNENLEMYVVDTDNGCGVIKRGQQILVPYEELTFNKFIQHKIKWMNVISVEKFKELI